MFLVGLLQLPVAADGETSPVYQRQRTAYGNHAWAGGNYAAGAPMGVIPGGAVVGYPWPVFTPPVAGSWYQRPYPEHMEYFRLIQQAPAQVPGSPNCFCISSDHDFSQ